ncbi:MAG TPA: restriction endonuclease [Candidatus Rifleibacterium sp.]|nr:restriction endonuclease [Candidatus Rifleibacterium sp.]
MKASLTVWGIHAGRFGDAESLFIEKKCVALGWHEVGSLKKIGKARDDFKEALIKTYPAIKKGAIPNNAGQLYRFVHEMKVGDLIVYPRKSHRTVQIGKITGEYEFVNDEIIHYPNRRRVEWLKELPRTAFTQGALYEMGSAMSFFQIKNYSEEIQKKLDLKPGKAIIEDPEGDESIALVAEEIEETTRDFILKQLSQELKGHPFTDFVAHLLTLMGYHTRVSPEGPDGGIDIIAHTDELGFVPPIIKVQVKSSDGTIGDPPVSSLYGKVGQNEFGLFVTMSTFSSPAKSFARSKSNLRLIDGQEFVDIILRYYEQMDSRYKGIIPLKKVFVPQPIDEKED